MMAQFMCDKKKHVGSFLDIGTGSGILALIAFAYGSQDIWALDIDPVAIKTAANNCRINRCRFKYLKAIKFEKLKSKKQFDFVASNLLTEDLIRMRSRLISTVKPGGYLAVSGIYCENYPAFRKNFAGAGIEQAQVKRKKKWYAVLFKRHGSLTVS
jgi:ribosomal protein L11 methyltransferase